MAWGLDAGLGIAGSMIVQANFDKWCALRHHIWDSSSTQIFFLRRKEGTKARETGFSGHYLRLLSTLSWLCWDVWVFSRAESISIFSSFRVCSQESFWSFWWLRFLQFWCWLLRILSKILHFQFIFRLDNFTRQRVLFWYWDSIFSSWWSCLLLFRYFNRLVNYSSKSCV